MTDSQEPNAVDGAHPPIVRTPPTVPRALPVPLSRWPAILGVISIVLGGCGILTNSCGVFGAFGQGLIREWVTSQQGATSPQMQQQMSLMKAGMPNMWLMVLSYCLALFTSVLLLIAGIQCVRRQSMARILHLVWAVARTVAAVLAGVAGYLSWQGQVQMMQGIAAQGGANPGMPPGMAGFMSIFGILGIVLAFAWSVAYPIVVLVWFNKQEVKAEVQGWANGVR